MSLLSKNGAALYALAWQNKKGEVIRVEAPTKEDVKELFTWIVQETGMKEAPKP